MKIILTGGGSGGHITPLLAVASEIKRTRPDCEIIAICEKGSKFAGLYSDSLYIDKLFQISAGKYRRYGGQNKLQKLLDIKTIILNIRDVFLTLGGCIQAYRLLKSQKPDAILFKGGFVAVPVGLAAAKLNIPFVTHDSDSTPGLANRIISKWAKYNATGMSAELYSYPVDKVRHVGIPLSDKFTKVDDRQRSKYRHSLELNNSDRVITIVGGSLGAKALNEGMISISDRLISRYPQLVILHVAGRLDAAAAKAGYKQVLGDESYSKHVRVFGFIDNVYEVQGAADIVITRAGATQTAELAIQGLPIIIVPANLAGSHQEKNAELFVSRGAAVSVSNGENEKLESLICNLLDDEDQRQTLSKNLADMALPDASSRLAELIISVAERG